MKEDTLSKHMKGGLQKTADALQKQYDSLKGQVKKVRENICEKAGKIVDVAKQSGRVALYRVAEVTKIRKKLLAIKDKVAQAIDMVEDLEQSVSEYYRGQQRKTDQEVSALENCVVAESQGKYGAEMFEQYQREHGAEKGYKAAGQTVRQEAEKSR